MSAAEKACSGARQRTHTRWRSTSSGTSPGTKPSAPSTSATRCRADWAAPRSRAITVWPPPLGTDETSSVSRPAGSPPPSTSSIERTAAGRPPQGLRALSGKRAARSDRSAETVCGGPGTCAHLLKTCHAGLPDQPNKDALRFQLPLGDDVAVALVLGAQHGAAAHVHEPLERRRGLVHERRDDLADARLA